MTAEESSFRHQQLTENLIGVFYEVYNELGYGFLESVYESALSITFGARSLHFHRQSPVPVWFRGIQIGDFKADFVVEDAVILEIKAARALDPSHEAQLLNYLRATPIEVGLLFNFGPKPQFKRFAFDNERKKVGVYQRSSAAGGL
jgi:GxxExxY protein